MEIESPGTSKTTPQPAHVIACVKGLSEVTFRGIEIRDLEILGMGSWTEEAGFRSSQGWAEERAQWYQPRAGHRRNGDLGLWARH